jgi:5'-methylthioadenosine/S-adenosylhomocysteine nucleosidase
MKKIGIIGAMDLEVDALKAKLSQVTITSKARMEFYEGILNGAEVVVVRCGIGKINAAVCVQILVDLFAVTHIINTGVAGSLNAELDIGDILISKDAVHHDVNATIFGYAPGEVPQLGIREPLYVTALKYAGITVTDLIRRMKGRVPCIHLKDLDVQVNKPVTAPVGWGNMDFDAILAACEDAGAVHLLVEQDDCYEDPFVCLKKSYDFLRARGLY